MKKNKKRSYSTPVVEILQLYVERGFLVSQPGSSEGTGEDIW